MIRTTRIPIAGLFFLGMATATLSTGCSNQAYTSPEQQTQNACQAFGPKTLSGAAIGALGGAAGGAGLGAMAGGGRGALIGAGVGGAIAGLIGGLAVGHSLDQRDCAAAQQALAQVRYLSVGQSAPWRNPQTGNYGSYTPVSEEYPGSNNEVCRQVRQDTMLHGHEPTTQVEVTCRQPNGDYATVRAPAA